MTRRASAGSTGPAGLGLAPALALVLAACATGLPTSSPEPSPIDASPSPACGTGEAAFRDAAAQLDRQLLFEGQPLQLVTAAMSMRDGSVSADDVIPEFVGLSADTKPVHLPPGVAGLLAGRGGLELIGAQITVYDWEDFTFAEGELPSAHSEGTAGVGRPDGRGGISVIAPGRAGDYVLGLTLQWQTACLSGDGVAYARLIVD